MDNKVDTCNIDRKNNIASIKFSCGFELRVEDDKIIYKINNQSTIKPNTEKNRLEMHEIVKKTYGESVWRLTLFFCIQTKI